MLSSHFKWALNQIFKPKPLLMGLQKRPHRVIILEEDLQIAPDFFEYFAAVSHLLKDQSVLGYFIVGLFCYICSFLLFVWLSFFTYALLAATFHV
jgi:hypothetical protein